MGNEVCVSVPRCVHRHGCVQGPVSPLLGLPHRVGDGSPAPGAAQGTCLPGGVPGGWWVLTTIPAWVPVFCPGWARRGAGLLTELWDGARWWPGGWGSRRLSLASSLTALSSARRVGLGLGGATSPESHEASGLEASCRARARAEEGGAGRGSAPLPAAGTLGPASPTAPSVSKGAHGACEAKGTGGGCWVPAPPPHLTGASRRPQLSP